MQIHRVLLPACLVALAACSRQPTLETRTFALQYINGGKAQDLVKPYVYEDRPGAAGAYSGTDGAITVRETPDNLDKIARVLQEYDHPALNVSLHFQVILADGAAPVDSSIAPVVTQLRRLFRFDGYRLLAEAQATGTENSHIAQLLQAGDVLGPMTLEVRILSVRGSADSGIADMEVALRNVSGRSMGELQTQVGARIGQTVVLGSTQFSGSPGTVILTVRPELAGN